MIKGLLSALFGALLVAAVIAGIVYLFFSGMLLSILGFVAGGLIVAAIILFGIVFIFAIIIFFALFYYMAEKKPEVTPGEYKLEEEKGKND
jgi:phosphotransferase system  glucose/maltose/N-acetylglucosamine-specific IIC component